MRYAYKREYIWSENIAYLVGLMTSDGCLSKDGRHLDLTSIDLEQIENFCTAIGRPITVTKKKNGRGGYAFRTQLSDVRLYDFLINAGLTPNKSLTIEKVSIPDLFYSDFLRGLLDGDGSVYGYKAFELHVLHMFCCSKYKLSKIFTIYKQTPNRNFTWVYPGLHSCVCTCIRKS